MKMEAIGRKRYRTYRCQNDECPYYLSHNKKRRKTLFKGVIVGESWAIDRCDACNTDVYINVEKEKPIDADPKSALKYLLGNHAGS